MDNKIILLVEDNPDHSLLITRGLEEHPMVNDIHHVGDGEKALEYLFRRGVYEDPELSPQPDLILLDLRLPRVSGLDVLEAITKDEVLRRVASAAGPGTTPCANRGIRRDESSGLEKLKQGLEGRPIVDERNKQWKSTENNLL